MTLRDAIREETGVDIRDADELPGEGTWAKRVDDLLSKSVEPKLEQPTFVLDYPKELSPVRQGPPLRARPRGALRVLRRAAWSSRTRSPS